MRMPNIGSEEKEEDGMTDLSETSDIKFWLDGYHDIFSDFDPRPYKVKALSIDFLDEAKRASIDKEAPITINLFVPKNKRVQKDEKIIKSRLGKHFQRHFELLREERRDAIKRGLKFIFPGIILMLIATFILLRFEQKSFLASFLVVLLEPGGWFLFWEGLYMIVFESKEKKKDYIFYEKMTKSKIAFESYKSTGDVR